MWTEEATAERCLDCRLPFSFYFDLIADCWLSPPASSNNLTLHRICTLARKQGARFVVCEDALGRADVREDVDALNAHYGGNGRASAIQLSFFASDISPETINGVDPAALIATAVIVNFAPSTDFQHSYIFESIMVPPHQVDGAGARKQLLNNYMTREAEFERSVRGRTFKLKGFYYCQQNGLVHVCAHACLRMALNSTDGVSAPVSNGEINKLLSLTPPLTGLSLGNIVSVIKTRTGIDPVIADCSNLSPTDYLSVLTSYLESGFVVLFVFTTSNQMEHVVTAFGHTRNSDEWHPQAIPGYSGPKTAPFYPSSAWVDHFLIHDDNLGPYYTLSSRAFEVDPSIKAHWIIGIHPHQAQILPSYAESLSAIMLRRNIPAVKQLGSGKWFGYLSSQPWTFVMRPILIDRQTYKEHLRTAVAHDQTAMTDQELSLLDALPEWFWMVEFSLPALFTGNRSKLGELLIRTDVSNGAKPVDLLEAIRLPSLLLSKDPQGKFVSSKVSLMAHSPIYSPQAHGNEW